MRLDGKARHHHQHEEDVDSPNTRTAVLRTTLKYPLADCDLQSPALCKKNFHGHRLKTAPVLIGIVSHHHSSLKLIVQGVVEAYFYRHPDNKFSCETLKLNMVYFN